MSILRRLVCVVRGHDWQARRFDYEAGYCKACRRCEVRCIVHDWNACVCGACGFKRDAENAAHDWDGCRCVHCGLQRHDWHPWNEGDRCRLCGEFRLSWQDYLQQAAGKSFADDADFVLAVGEAIRKELYAKYERARDSFKIRAECETKLVYRAPLRLGNGLKPPDPPALTDRRAGTAGDR